MEAEQTPAFTLTASRGFAGWLASTGGSLAFTTYQAGKVFFLGVRPDGVLSVFERSFPRPMGLAVSGDGRTLMMATQVQIYRFDNALLPGEREGDHDAVFLPTRTWITGDLDIHDLAIGPGEEPVFANTLFNCIATTAPGSSFRPLWRPPFISRLAAEDRCHLNGLAMEDGQPRYASCLSRSDVTDGWRDRRRDGGLVIDIARNEILAEGLSMPHSPRLHEGRLWLLNSGTGDLGRIDAASGRFIPVAFCPGYARGLAFAGHLAIVGLSRARENRTFEGLALHDALRRRDTEARCGLHVVDTRTGDAANWVRIDGVIDELYDVAFLPGPRTPSAVGILGPGIRHKILVAPDGPSSS